uniref:Secreted protein n=1 Tax=Schistocephalus solidus TaxID=70667 RepID=A0A0X3Q711_SCHSO
MSLLAVTCCVVLSCGRPWSPIQPLLFYRMKFVKIESACRLFPRRSCRILAVCKWARLIIYPHIWEEGYAACGLSCTKVRTRWNWKSPMHGFKLGNMERSGSRKHLETKHSARRRW